MKHDDDLISLLVSRAEIDLPQIKHEYRQILCKDLDCAFFDAKKMRKSEEDYVNLFFGLIRKSGEIKF